MTEQSKEYKIEGRPSTIYRVVKNKENPYVMIDRRPINNPVLSFKAKGILTYLMSRPDGWEVSVADLIKHGTDGEAAVRSGLKELKEAGHMKYTQSRNEGRITGWLIEVYEIPQSPDRDFQQVENQDIENQDIENQRQVVSKLHRKQKPIKKASTPKPPPPEEVIIYREVVNLYPPKQNWDDVVKIFQSVSKRLGHPVTADDLMPFFKAWTFRGFKPTNMNWTSWAVSGVIPNQQKQNAQQPRGFSAVQQWVESKGLSNGD